MSAELTKSYIVERKISKNDRTGLSEYGMSSFPGTRRLYFAGFDHVTGKYKTGLDISSPDVLRLPEPEKSKKIEFIKSVVEEVESFLGSPGILDPKSTFWDDFGVAFESTSAGKSTIIIRGQTYDILSPATNPIHKLAMVMLTANKLIPKSKKEAYSPEFRDAAYYLYTEDEMQQESKATVRREIARGTELGKLFGDEIQYDRAWNIAYYLGYKPKNGISEEILQEKLYMMTKDPKEADRFLKACKLANEDILTANIFKKAVVLDIIKYNKEGKCYFSGGNNYRETEEDSIELLKTESMAAELIRLKELVDKKSKNRKNLA